VPTLEMLRSRRDEIETVALRHRAGHVRVFGSVCRGEAVVGSDVDFLVDFDADASLLDQVGLEQALGQLLGLEVDVVSSGGLLPHHDLIRDEATEL
jgi:predicted nucleotidyltransferase